MEGAPWWLGPTRSSYTCEHASAVVHDIVLSCICAAPATLCIVLGQCVKHSLKALCCCALSTVRCVGQGGALRMPQGCR